MMLSPTLLLRPYLLDTNILIHAVRQNETWEQIKTVCDPLMTLPKPWVNIVTHGELRAFAEIKERGEEKRDRRNFYLDYFEDEDINDREIIDAYALIDTFSRTGGIRMGKKDLWIAATAHVTGSPLVTTDTDFDHLHDKFIPRILINPAV